MPPGSRRVASAAALLAAIAALLACACGRSDGPAVAGAAASGSATSPPARAGDAGAAAGGAGSAGLEAQAGAPVPGDAAATPADLPGRTDGCPEGMVRVEGEYCPVVEQTCLEHHPDWDKHQGDKGVAERCLRFREPSRCLVERVHLDYCMDRFEYPGVVGQLPRVLTSWLDAGQMCRARRKRLCTEREFNFACEGPEMLPYVYGYVRDPAICNQDKDYRLPDHGKQMLHYDSCMRDERCAGEMARLDQREPIFSRPRCVSWAGIFDLNGNANEWVVRTDQKPPHRSGLKGGWWGPIRSRCRPMTTFHPEDDYGYEVGFRCCADGGSKG